MSTVQTRVGTFVWHEQVSSEPAEAKEFYGQLFGWGTEVFGEGEFDYAMIAVGEQTHGGYAKAMEGAPPPHWLGHVLVESTDETVEKAKAAGGTLLAGPFDMSPFPACIVSTADSSPHVSEYVFGPPSTSAQ